MTISNFGAAGVRPGVCTSTTRPTTPYNGQVIYETDTGYLRVWDGSAWDYLSTGQATIPGAWQSYTPTVAQIATLTPTIHYAKYTIINKTVIGNVGLTIASGTGSAGTGLSVTLPVAIVSASNQAIGSVWIYDNSTATAYNGVALAITTTTMLFGGDWSGGATWGGTPAIAFGTSDQLRISFHYEIA